MYPDGLRLFTLILLQTWIHNYLNQFSNLFTTSTMVRRNLSAVQSTRPVKKLRFHEIDKTKHMLNIRIYASNFIKTLTFLPFGWEPSVFQKRAQCFYSHCLKSFLRKFSTWTPCQIQFVSKKHSLHLFHKGGQTKKPINSKCLEFIGKIDKGFESRIPSCEKK